MLYGTSNRPRRRAAKHRPGAQARIAGTHRPAPAGPGEAYGYEIVSKLTAETNGALEVTDGTLYPVLYRLERAGFVAVRWETPERGVPRKYYTLTTSGRQELQRLTDEWTTFANAMAKLLRR